MCIKCTRRCQSWILLIIKQDPKYIGLVKSAGTMADAPFLDTAKEEEPIVILTEEEGKTLQAWHGGKMVEKQCVRKQIQG